MTEGLVAAGIEDEAQIVGRSLCEDLADELRDPPGRRCVFAVRGPQRPADHRVERPVDERVAVDQVNRLRCLIRH